VLVGEQITVGGYDDPGAGAATGALGLIRAPDIDTDDGGSHGLDCPDDGGGVGIQGILEVRSLGKGERGIEHWRGMGLGVRKLKAEPGYRFLPESPSS
jgi:hypothetical protein